MNFIRSRASLVLLALMALGGCTYHTVPAVANPERDVRVIFSPWRSVVLHAPEGRDSLVLANVLAMDVRIIEGSADSVRVLVRRADLHPGGTQRFTHGTTATLEVYGMEAQQEGVSVAFIGVLALVGLLIVAVHAAVNSEPTPPPTKPNTK